MCKSLSEGSPKIFLNLPPLYMYPALDNVPCWQTLRYHAEYYFNIFAPGKFGTITISHQFPKHASSPK